MDFDLIMPAGLVAPLMRHAGSDETRQSLQGFWVGPADRLEGEDHDSIIAVATEGHTLLIVRSPGFASKWCGWQPTPLGATTLKKATVGRAGDRMLFGIPTGKEITREAVIWQTKELTEIVRPSASGFRPDKATIQSMEIHSFPDVSRVILDGIRWEPGSCAALSATNLRRATETATDLARAFDRPTASATLQFMHNANAKENDSCVHAATFGAHIPAFLVIMPYRDGHTVAVPPWLNKGAIWRAMGITQPEKAAAA